MLEGGLDPAPSSPRAPSWLPLQNRGSRAQSGACGESHRSPVRATIKPAVLPNPRAAGAEQSSSDRDSPAPSPRQGRYGCSRVGQRHDKSRQFGPRTRADETVRHRGSLLSMARLCYGEENNRKLNVKLVYPGRECRKSRAE